jgi:hypothetical protein
MLPKVRRPASFGWFSALLVAQLGCGTDDAGKGGPVSNAGAGAGGATGLAGAAGNVGVTGGTANAGAGGGESGIAGNVGGGDTGGASGGVSGGDAGGMPCVKTPALMPSGAAIEVTPPMTIAAALAKAQPGERIVLHAGNYTNESISKLSFAQHVFIQAADGESVTLPGLHFVSCDHVVIDGLHVDGTLELEGSGNFVLRHVTLAGQGEDAALQFQGQHAAGASHDISVEDSSIGGGGRTVFILGKFAPAEQWNHHLSFRRNHFGCGSHNCFQVSGGRDLDIVENEITSDTTAGVLTAGATRVNILQNTFVAKDGAAMQIATPGMEWDNYAGVENMISSKVVIANNVVSGFKTGVQLDAASDVAIVYNTFVDGAGVRFNHRTPHDQANNVILDGNENIRIWNDIMQQLAVAQVDKPPALLSNNLISGSGSAGDNVVTGDPLLDAGMSFALKAGSPAIDKSLVNAETPLIDFDGRARGDKPDLGAHELGAMTSACPEQ